MQKLTVIMESYLETIYELSMNGNGARISDIAKKLGVTKASTHSAMSTLSTKGLIINERYKEVFLTPAGLKQAEFISQKHYVIEQFFTEVLKLEANNASSDACAIEHVISNEAITAMQEFLQNRNSTLNMP